MNIYQRWFFAGLLVAPLLGCSSRTHTPASTPSAQLPAAAPAVVKSATAPAPATDSSVNTNDNATATTAATTTTDANDTDNTTPAAPEQNVDPYEKFNRAMFAFNDFLDYWLLHPISKGYNTVTPPPIRKGVSNFFDNVDMLTTIPNDLLQGKSAYFAADTWRFILNSTLGIGGLFDIATRVGLPKHHEDFGLTLAYWSGEDGLKPQPYLMLPFFGPSTTRDAFGKIPNAASWPFNYIQPEYYNYGAIAMNAVSKRADLLPADKLVKESFDPYIFIRSAYLQTRNHSIEKNRQESNFSPYTTGSQDNPAPEDAGNEL